jgi:Uma2 family endonuclease
MAMQALDPSRWGGKALPGQDELPSEDGEPMETGFHDAQDALLKDTLLDAWRDRRDFFVAGNMFVYFSERQVRANDFRGPDVFVVLDVEAKGRKSWVAWEEGGRLPDVVIEVTSDSTAHVDRGEKMRIYSQIWRTSAYFVFDPDSQRLEGFRLDAAGRRYQPLEPDERGDLDVAVLGLKLGLRPTRYRQYDQPFVRWLDADGMPLPTPQERAEAEQNRAEAERSRAEVERTRAEAERSRAEVERARADELAARLRELEAK